MEEVRRGNPVVLRGGGDRTHGRREAMEIWVCLSKAMSMSLCDWWSRILRGLKRERGFIPSRRRFSRSRWGNPQAAQLRASLARNRGSQSTLSNCLSSFLPPGRWESSGGDWR